MKKLSLVLAILLLATCFAIYPVLAEDALTQTVFVFDFDEIPFAKGKNGQCYFPNEAKVPDASFPEIYTWNTCTIVSDGDYIRADVKSNMMFEFDSMPKSFVINKTLSYLMVMVKSDKAVSNGKIAILSQGNKYKRTYSVNLTGKWQKIILDLTGNDGWTMKGEDGQYTSVSEAAWTDGKFGGGGFRIDFPGSAVVANYLFDSIGFFTTEDGAKDYKTRATAENTDVIKTVGSVAAPSTGTATTTPATTPTTPTTEEIEDKWEPSMFNAVKKEDKTATTGVAFKSVAPFGATADDNKMLLKFDSMTAGESKGSFMTGFSKNPKINTYGTISNVSISDDLLKIELGSGNLFEMTNFGLGLTSGKYPYLIIGYKSGADAGGAKNGWLYNAGNVIRMNYSFVCDGEWHYDIYNLLDKDKMQQKVGSAYVPSTDAGFTQDITKVGFGAFRIDFPRYADNAVFYIDYIASFKSEEEAKAFAAESVKNLANNLPKEEEKTEDEVFSYMNGYTDGTFKPNNKMTRAEAITVIARLVGTEETIAEKRTTKYTDIKEADWYYNYITYLESFGMLANFTGTIEPGKNITRGEFIKLAYEAKAFEFSNKRPKFDDLETTHPYYKEICLGYAAGAITGYPDNTIKPDGEITRAEIVTIVNRILGIEGSEAPATFSDVESHWAKANIMAAVGK